MRKFILATSLVLSGCQTADLEKGLRVAAGALNGALQANDQQSHNPAPTSQPASPAYQTAYGQPSPYYANPGYQPQNSSLGYPYPPPQTYSGYVSPEATGAIPNPGLMFAPHP